MKRISVFLFLTIILIQSLHSQNRLDSLIALKDLDTIQGRILTYFTPGNREISYQFQQAIDDAINYYETKYKISITNKIKLAVLDSAQWIDNYFPYGYVFVTKGWIVMNTGMPFNKFKHLYGFDSYSEKLDQELRTAKISPEELMLSVFKFYSLHEFGHHLVYILNVKSFDRWTNEFLATFISYEYYKQNEPKILNALDIFSKVNKENYIPKYRTLEEFNTLYAKVGLKNYLWYHSNFYFLVQELYNCKEDSFIDTYKDIFPIELEQKLTLQQFTEMLDEKCGGIVRTWTNELEGLKSNSK